MSFAFLSDNEKVEVKLIPRTGRECPPMITIQKGNIIKKYICENMGKKGLLIDLISLTVRNYDRSVTREFLPDSYSIIIRGLGYSTEITMHRNPACSKLLLNEEELLKALLEKGAFDVMKTFRILHLYASKEMTYKTVNIRLYKEPDEYSLSGQWELLQSLKVFSGCLFKYESKDPLAGMFSRTLSYESQDYLDHISGNIRHEHTKKVFKKEQQKCEDFVSFLNFYNNEEATKELSLTNYQG